MLIACIRHASTEWNATGRMQGRRDIALSPAGRDEVMHWRLPADLHESVDWIASPLSRAIETATRLRGRPPRVEPALSEMDWGAWEGCRLAELLAIATGWDMTDKPPVKLRPGTLHRFALGDGGSLALVECNVPLANRFSEPRPAPPPTPRPPAPSATLP
jgi:broad specificity phosphatase PhoE